MNTGKRWQRLAERLAESGWSWRHVRLTDRVGRIRHVAEAHNEEAKTHVVTAHPLALHSAHWIARSSIMPNNF